MRLQRHHAPGASPTTPARPPEGGAPRRSPVPGAGNVVVRRVRQTATHVLELGQPVLTRARAAQDSRHGAMHLAGEPRAHLDTQLTTALQAHPRIEPQSRRLTQGQSMPHCHGVHASDPTLAPLCTGTSHGPAQFGRKPGMIAEPAAGFIGALDLPVGQPRDVRYVEPLVDKVEQAIAWVRTRPTPAIPSRAGDLAGNDAAVREALPARGILSVGLAPTVDPCPLSPTPADVSRMLDEADVHDIRTPSPGHLVSACGESRPVVDSLRASLRCRGAGRLPYKGHRGAIVPTGMAVMAPKAATLVRLQASCLAKRARLCRRRLRLRCRTGNQCHALIH
jgi:hypothetical protein